MLLGEDAEDLDRVLHGVEDALRPARTGEKNPVLLVHVVDLPRGGSHTVKARQRKKKALGWGVGYQVVEADAPSPLLVGLKPVPHELLNTRRGLALPDVLERAAL